MSPLEVICEQYRKIIDKADRARVRMIAAEEIGHYYKAGRLRARLIVFECLIDVLREKVRQYRRAPFPGEDD